jgi:DNA-binding winged helix-turn-helix (wHTH) protein
MGGAFAASDVKLRAQVLLCQQHGPAYDPKTHTRAHMNETSKAAVLRFGSFELDLDAQQLLKNGRIVRLQPQPFRLLRLLIAQPGKLVTREEIQAALWKDDTFVDFEQGVNFAIKQVREALGDRAEHPLYIQTVPKRGYRFLAPITAAGNEDVAEFREPMDPRLQRALWENIVDLRIADEQRRKQQRVMTAALVCLAVAVLVLFVMTLY